MKNIHKTGKELYITSDEEIKEGDWYLDTFNNQRIKANQFSDHKHYGNACKKIILTTDLELQKDGVQAIDDEFLKWFVKNPSCEEVEIERWFDTSHIDLGVGKVYHNNPNMPLHKIIIPKEEPKQDEIMERFIANAKQETLEEYTEDYKPSFVDLADTLSKQETLEEASLLSRPIHLIWDEGERYDCNEEFREEFKKGAKWQQKLSYSQLDVVRILSKYETLSNEDFNKWFAKYKKK